ncbi:MAG: hypothetical protein HFI38_14175 [Lachnospiraceae bacterium]|jgi:hypothetical protein|nr:hypothetical protein [Lachnospiraceae bacterium]
MENFNDTAKSIAEDAVRYAMQSGIRLDYTGESAQNVDAFLGACHDSLDKYDGDEGAKTLWNVAVLFGTYTGEMLLRCGLAEKGFTWVEDDGLPILSIPGSQTAVSPITKAHKRILNGEEDSMKSFVDVVFSAVNGEWPKTGVLRVPDVETASGKKIERIVLKESDYYISLVAEGKEDFVIFKSHDGFFQFYGIGNQFVCEAWFNLGGRRAYALINPDCTNTERVDLVTPFGEYTPRELDIISLEQLKTAVYEYFSNLEETDFLAKVPHERMEM